MLCCTMLCICKKRGINSCFAARLSLEAGFRRNLTSTLYSAPGYFLCIKDKKCVIYSQSRYHDNDCVFFPLPIAYYRHNYWPLNCKQCKPNRQKSHHFSLASEILVPMKRFPNMPVRRTNPVKINSVRKNIGFHQTDCPV